MILQNRISKTLLTLLILLKNLSFQGPCFFTEINFFSKVSKVFEILFCMQRGFEGVRRVGEVGRVTMKREDGNARVMRRGYVGGWSWGGWSRVCEAVQQGVWEDGTGCVRLCSRVCGRMEQGVWGCVSRCVSEYQQWYLLVPAVVHGYGCGRVCNKIRPRLKSGPAGGSCGDYCSRWSMSILRT